MAAPGLPVHPKVFYDYTSDDGQVYKMLVSTYIATQNTTGGASIIGAVATGATKRTRWPRSWKPRRAIVRDTVHNVDKTVPVLSPTAPLITVPTPAGGGALALNTGVNNTETYTYQGQFKTEVTAGRRP